MRCPLVFGVVTDDAVGQQRPKAELGALSHCARERANRFRKLCFPGENVNFLGVQAVWPCVKEGRRGAGGAGWDILCSPKARPGHPRPQ